MENNIIVIEEKAQRQPFKKVKEKYKDKNFPFNERAWVPEIIIDNTSPYYIRVVSYNILCDSLITISTNLDDEEYKKFPYMHWENRKPKIIAELIEINADIINIQEFERDENLIEEMGKLGYDCAFKPRTGNHSEGCAIFWKNTKFNVENLYCIEFNMNTSPKDISPIYDRDNICLISVLQYKALPNICFIVANAHLLFNKNRGDIKIAQTYQILSGLNLVKDIYSKKYTQVNCFFCGDLNAVPNSGVYKLITEGSLDCNKIDKRKISGQSQGAIELINPSKLKTTLLSQVTTKFRENYNESKTPTNNDNWFNDILRVETVINNDTQSINLAYKNKYIYQSNELILKSNFTMKSAYAENLTRILDYLKNSNKEGYKFPAPFDNLIDPNTLENIDVYGIKVGYKEIDKTLNFVKNYTLEPPFSFYGKGLMALVDFIFYSGNITPVRTLNIPDMNKVAFDIGYFPTELFPSDHISLCADFFIQNI